MHPTKHQIALLYAHNFKLWDGSRQWQIESLHKEGISIVMDESDTLPNSITFEDIGRGFKVIRKPLSDLTVADGDGKSAMDRIQIYEGVDYLIEQLKTGLAESIVYDMVLSLGFFPSLADDCCVDVDGLNE